MAGERDPLTGISLTLRLLRANARQDVHEFATSEECIKELKKGGWDIWATDLSDVCEPCVDDSGNARKMPLAGMFFR